MRLPDLVAYQAAVQHPATAFSDPALKAASVVTGRLGLPRAVSGNFAVTYELRKGAQRWAVRCFHRDAADRASRYAAISQTLASARDGPLVPIDYIENGVRVGPTWYPITRMAWIDGRPLNVAIEQHLDQPSALDELERRLRSLVANLRQHGIAHGDLQHGNILVDASRMLRLVDYDGMFVPALRGRAASETGDPNYQHPQRSTQFNADLDRFAAIVIVIALRALRAEPDLWPEYNSGDNLLFRRADFADPSRSALFRDLHSIPALRELTERFVRVCENDYAQIPTLAEFVRVTVNKARTSWSVRRATLQTAIAISSTDRLVATGEREGKIHIRERDSGRARRSLSVDAPVESLAFTPSGHVQVVTCGGPVVTTWSTAETSNAKRTFSVRGRRVRAVALSSNAEWLAAAGDRGELRCWRVPTGRVAGTFAVGHLVAVAVCVAGKRFAIADARGDIHVWRLRDGQRIGTLALGRGVTCLALSQTYLAVGQANGCVSVWDIQSGQPAFREFQLAGPVMGVALSSDCASVAATARDGTVCLRTLRPRPKSAVVPIRREPRPIVRVFAWLKRVALL